MLGTIFRPRFGALVGISGQHDNVCGVDPKESVFMVMWEHVAY